MTDWTHEAQAAVAKAMLGSWPQQVAGWGRDALAAFISELRARGVTAERALLAIRTGPWNDFPPNAARLAEEANRDPCKPTPAEALQLVYGPRGVLRASAGPGSYASLVDRARAEDRAKLARAAAIDGQFERPWLGSFIASFGLDRLRSLEVDHETYGEVNRKRFEQAWAEFVEVFEHRSAVALVSGRRGELAPFDPLSALSGVPRRQLRAGSES